jgi:hypothetical protein
MEKKVKLQTGLTISAEVYDDKNNLVGDFIFCCSYCGFEYVWFSTNAKRLHCGKCNANLGYLLKDKFKRPEDSPGRKCLGFYMDNGSEYVWTCHCGHRLHKLVNKMNYTICEKCESRTSRRKDMATMAKTDEVSWNV